MAQSDYRLDVCEGFGFVYVLADNDGAANDFVFPE
jgi:hypothetical protein